MRKLLLALILAGLLTLVTATAAFAGGKVGGFNGNSGQSNPPTVCHVDDDGSSFTLWLGSEKAKDAHIAHGDTLGVCAINPQ